MSLILLNMTYKRLSLNYLKYPLNMNMKYASAPSCWTNGGIIVWAYSTKKKPANANPKIEKPTLVLLTKANPSKAI